MPNKRIDQLDANLNPLTGQELIPIFDKNTNTTERISIDTLASYIDISDDTITGGTYNNTTKTLTLEKNGGTEINITGFTDFYTTGVTLNGTTLEFNRTDSSNAYLVDLSSLKFTGNTSGDCISDIHVSNIHSCSPLRINPNDEGDIYFGSSNSVVIDVISGTISATTYYGDGSNLINLPSGGETFTGGTVSGDTNFLNTVTASILSATTIYGDGSNLINLPSGGGTFTGGTVTGLTEFTNGLITNTIYSPSFIGDGSQLTGVVGLTYSDLGFTITSPTPTTINQNVVLPYNSTVTYPSPLTVDSGFSVTIPSGTTLTII